MSVLDFIVLTLAASAVVDVWFNGSLFADWRAFFQSTADDVSDVSMPVPTGDNLSPLQRLADRWVPTWVAEMLGCSFCFSHHTPWILALVCFLPAALIPWYWLAFLFKLPAYSLAATRLGNLINAWAPAGAKYEK